MYTTVEQATQPCIAQPTIDAPHKWFEGATQNSCGVNSDVAVILSYVCRWCLIEIDANDVDKYREALRASAGLE